MVLFIDLFFSECPNECYENIAFNLGYRISNHYNEVQDLIINFEPKHDNVQIVYSGYKQHRVTLLPYSSYDLNFVIHPLSTGLFVVPLLGFNHHSKTPTSPSKSIFDAEVKPIYFGGNQILLIHPCSLDFDIFN